jgi:hypothetical protein
MQAQETLAALASMEDEAIAALYARLDQDGRGNEIGAVHHSPLRALRGAGYRLIDERDTSLGPILVGVQGQSVVLVRDDYGPWMVPVTEADLFEDDGVVTSWEDDWRPTLVDLLRPGA